jgi:hypothetical protein
MPPIPPRPPEPAPPSGRALPPFEQATKVSANTQAKTRKHPGTPVRTTKPSDGRMVPSECKRSRADQAAQIRE